MLDESVARLARDRIRLDIGQQHGRIESDIHRARVDFSARGMLRSGAFIVRVVEICSDAVTERAHSAWQTLHHVVATSRVAYYDGLAQDLQSLVLEFFPNN